jgi:hypothetical protein
MNKAFAASLLVAATLAGYTDQQAKISLELSQNAYCGHGHYLTHTYTGAASGFVATKSIYSGIW